MSMWTSPYSRKPQTQTKTSMHYFFTCKGEEPAWFVVTRACQLLFAESMKLKYMPFFAAHGYTIK